MGWSASCNGRYGAANEEVISAAIQFPNESQELGTLAQYGINVKTVIINNGWQGMVRQWQQAFFGAVLVLKYGSSSQILSCWLRRMVKGW